MFKGSGYNLSDIAAVTGNRNGDGFFGENGWWIILLFLFTGWGRGGFGFGGEGYGAPCATQADVRAAVDQQTLISKLDQQTYGLADSTYALNNAITTGFNGVDMAICNLAHEIGNGFCTNGRLIEKGFADTNYNLATQACETRHAICDSTRDIIANNNAGIKSILDFLTQDKIATLTAENQSLKFAASQANQNAFIVANQEAQTAELIRRLGVPAPVPAYVVANPNCCYNPCGCAN